MTCSTGLFRTDLLWGLRLAASRVRDGRLSMWSLEVNKVTGTMSSQTGSRTHLTRCRIGKDHRRLLALFQKGRRINRRRAPYSFTSLLF